MSSFTRTFDIQIPQWFSRILPVSMLAKEFYLDLDIDQLGLVKVKFTLPTFQDAKNILNPLSIGLIKNISNKDNNTVVTQPPQLTLPDINLSISPKSSNFTPSYDFITYQTFENHHLVTSSKRILASDNSNSNSNPQLCSEGIGGTYFLSDDGKRFGVFKPSDEEPGALNNPKKSVEESDLLLPPGKGYLREVAAYLLDGGFAGVPETVLASGLCSSHFSGGSSVKKSGSLQVYVDHDCDASSLGSSLFSVHNVHRIGILDIRIFNLDRNGENLLVKKHQDGYELIPIDHTYILPPRDHLDSAWFDWQYWKQAKEPFSQYHLDYIASIDIEKDASILRRLGIEEQYIETMKVSTTVLKKGAAAGLTLFQITSLITRKPLTKPSMLEQWVKQSLIGDPNCQYVDIFLFSTLVDNYLATSVSTSQ